MRTPTKKEAKLLASYIPWDQLMPIGEREAAPLLEEGWLQNHGACAWAYTIRVTVTAEGLRALAALKVGAVEPANSVSA